jgi:uncharacterized membrane protein YcaP (DUF421 family)
MSRLERDGKITIIFKKGKPEIIIEGDINGRMIKSLPRHLMAAYRRLRLKAQKTEIQKEEEKKKEAKLDGRKSNVPSKRDEGGVTREPKSTGELK